MLVYLQILRKTLRIASGDAQHLRDRRFLLPLARRLVIALITVILAMAYVASLLPSALTQGKWIPLLGILPVAGLVWMILTLVVFSPAKWAPIVNRHRLLCVRAGICPDCDYPLTPGDQRTLCAECGFAMSRAESNAPDPVIFAPLLVDQFAALTLAGLDRHLSADTIVLSPRIAWRRLDFELPWTPDPSNPRRSSVRERDISAGIYSFMLIVLSFVAAIGMFIDQLSWGNVHFPLALPWICLGVGIILVVPTIVRASYVRTATFDLNARTLTIEITRHHAVVHSASCSFDALRLISTPWVRSASLTTQALILVTDETCIVLSERSSADQLDSFAAQVAAKIGIPVETPGITLRSA